MLKCIIIEDQVPAQRILQKYIADFGMLNLKETFTDALLALDFLKSESVDIIFLDVHLPKISGVDFIQILPKKHHIILTTAFSDYALKGYELDVVDYLLKPFSFQRFVKAVSKVGMRLESNNSTVEVENNLDANHNYMFLKSGYEHIKLIIKDINYIKSESDYTSISTTTKKHLVSVTLAQWNKRLEIKDFCQVHKSYIVNVHSISKVSGNQIIMEDGTKIPIGRGFKDAFMVNYIKNN
ncbi:MAG: response regulator transcription factor [Flavobacteriaceae bacterium]